MKGAYYRTYKPLFNLKKLLHILTIQLKVAELLKEECNIEVILYLISHLIYAIIDLNKLYLRTMTSKLRMKLCL